MKFNVKLPVIAGPSRLAGTVVVTTMSPKLVPAGVFTGFVVPLNVIVVVPLIFGKLTTLVPRTLKTPVVLKVTGSALAVTAAIDSMAVATASIKEVFKRVLMVVSSDLPLPVKPKARSHSDRLARGDCL